MDVYLSMVQAGRDECVGEFDLWDACIETAAEALHGATKEARDDLLPRIVRRLHQYREHPNPRRSKWKPCDICGGIFYTRTTMGRYCEAHRAEGARRRKRAWTDRHKHSPEFRERRRRERAAYVARRKADPVRAERERQRHNAYRRRRKAEARGREYAQHGAHSDH